MALPLGTHSAGLRPAAPVALRVDVASQILSLLQPSAPANARHQRLPGVHMVTVDCFRL